MQSGENRIDRTIYAHILEKLHAAGVKTIIYDILFLDKRLDSGDAKLVAATAHNAHTYYPCYVDQHGKTTEHENYSPLIPRVLFIPGSLHGAGRSPLVYPDAIRCPFTNLALAAAGLGFSNVDQDKDGIKRRIPLFYKSEQGYLPSLILAGICDFFQVDMAAIEIYYNHYLKLADAQYNGICKDFFIPIDEEGMLTIKFPGPAAQSLTHYPLDRIMEELEAEESPLPGLLKNTLVLIGDISTAGKDFGRGIFDGNYPNSFVLASAINTILTGNYLTTAGAVENMVFCMPVLLLIFLFLFITRNLRPWSFIISNLIFVFSSLLLIPAVIFCFFYFFNSVFRIVEIWLGMTITTIGLLAVKLQDFQALPEPIAEREADTPLPEPLADAGGLELKTVLQRLGIVTDRQQETALLLVRGLTNKEIGEKLYITVHAVKRRIQKIYQKCDVKNKTEFIKKVYGIKAQ